MFKFKLLLFVFTFIFSSKLMAWEEDKTKHSKIVESKIMFSHKIGIVEAKFYDGDMKKERTWADYIQNTCHKNFKKSINNKVSLCFKKLLAIGVFDPKDRKNTYYNKAKNKLILLTNAELSAYETQDATTNEVEALKKMSLANCIAKLNHTQTIKQDYMLRTLHIKGEKTNDIKTVLEARFKTLSKAIKDKTEEGFFIKLARRKCKLGTFNIRNIRLSGNKSEEKISTNTITKEHTIYFLPNSYKEFKENLNLNTNNSKNILNISIKASSSTPINSGYSKHMSLKCLSVMRAAALLDRIQKSIFPRLYNVSNLKKAFYKHCISHKSNRDKVESTLKNNFINYTKIYTGKKNISIEYNGIRGDGASGKCAYKKNGNLYERDPKISKKEAESNQYVKLIFKEKNIKKKDATSMTTFKWSAPYVYLFFNEDEKEYEKFTMENQCIDPKKINELFD